MIYFVIISLCSSTNLWKEIENRFFTQGPKVVNEDSVHLFLATLDSQSHSSFRNTGNFYSDNLDIYLSLFIKISKDSKSFESIDNLADFRIFDIEIENYLKMQILRNVVINTQ